MAIGQELLNVPMGDMIRQMAFAIAEAQVKLDQSSIEVAEMMGGLRTIYNEEGEVAFDDSRVFFGYEYMTLKEAEGYLSIDDALSGGKVADALKKIKEAQDAKGTDASTEIRVPTRVSMLELGFVPTFYQFVDTIIEVKIAIKITRTVEVGRKTTDRDSDTSTSSRKKHPFLGGAFGGRSSQSSRTTVSTSQVDASYSAKYSYSAEGSSLLRTKLSPLPPPPVLEDRIRAIMEAEAIRRQAKLDALLPKPPAPPTP
jgi:hypothetical protein